MFVLLYVPYLQCSRVSQQVTSHERVGVYVHCSSLQAALYMLCGVCKVMCVVGFHVTCRLAGKENDVSI